MTELLIYSRGTHGHRREYDAVLEKELTTIGITPTFVDKPTTSLLKRDIFFVMIEEDLIVFIVCALASLFGRNRVSGFMFRPGECFRLSDFKYRVKYLLFWGLRHLSTVRVWTLLPFSVNPRFAEVAYGWVYDPQLWDSLTLKDLKVAASTPLARDVSERANGRLIVVSLGMQNSAKGLNYFSEILCSSEVLRTHCFFVAAGKVAETSSESADRLRGAGAMVIDRYISDEELRSLYRVAHLVWAAYSPEYDQASGIIGRAFQFGLPVILRRGSYVAKLMQDCHYPVIEIDYGEAEVAASRIASLFDSTNPSASSAPMISAMRQDFKEKLRGCSTHSKVVCPQNIGAP